MKYYEFATNDCGHHYFEFDDTDMVYERELTASEIDAVIQAMSWELAECAARETGADMDLSDGELEDWYATEAERFYFDLWDNLMGGERLYF